jgi:hypothetical protein
MFDEAGLFRASAYWGTGALPFPDLLESMIDDLSIVCASHFSSVPTGRH